MTEKDYNNYIIILIYKETKTTKYGIYFSYIFFVKFKNPYLNLGREKLCK